MVEDTGVAPSGESAQMAEAIVVGMTLGWRSSIMVAEADDGVAVVPWNDGDAVRTEAAGKVNREVDGEGSATNGSRGRRCQQCRRD